MQTIMVGLGIVDALDELRRYAEMPEHYIEVTPDPTAEVEYREENTRDLGGVLVAYVILRVKGQLWRQLAVHTCGGYLPPDSFKPIADRLGFHGRPSVDYTAGPASSEPAGTVVALQEYVLH